jgi:hypothetical protein
LVRLPFAPFKSDPGLLTSIQVAPAVQRFAREYPHAVFAKVDVDAQKQIASAYQITAMYVI